jgi:hypothetical protein
MPQNRPSAAALRAEARLLTMAGLILLGLGFPTTLFFVAQALSDAAPPILPAAIGAPPLMLGYIACHFATKRLIRAKALEARR